jgi:hypothetical protein
MRQSCSRCKAVDASVDVMSALSTAAAATRSAGGVRQSRRIATYSDIEDAHVGKLQSAGGGGRRTTSASVCQKL